MTRLHATLVLLLAASGCVTPVSSGGDALCDNTCRFANDGDCDDGGEGADFDLCDLGTDCGDCGPRDVTPPPGPSRPGPTPPPVDHALPADMPPLNARYRSHVTWRADDSGLASLPNQEYSRVEELPRRDAVAMFGALPVEGEGMYELHVEDASAGEELRILVRSLDVGVYDVTGFDGEMARTEHRGGSYRYISAIEGGSGTVEILGRSDTAVWGRFEGRLCFASTPGVNCFTMYDGRFSATLP